MKKKFNLAKITSFVLLLTVTAMILVAGTYAKYSSEASGTGATVIAKWSFKVNGTEIAVKGDKPTVAFNLFETINDTKDGNVETDVADGLIAPGTAGSFEFVLNNSSEVTTKYNIGLEIEEGENVPLQFSIDGGQSWTDVAKLSDLVATDVMEIGSTKNVTVQWQWVFEGDTDATLGGETVKVTANITATQVDKTGELLFADKTALFVGDSVAYGYSTNGNGFGYYINEQESFKSFTNAAVNRATINTLTTVNDSVKSNNNVIEQLKANANNTYDFVIIEGGYGDLRDVPTLGELSSDYNVANLDTTTFAGAMEYTLYLATTTWENARVGFIVSYDVPNESQGIRSNYEETKKYWDMAKSACDKWNVDYLDFFEGSTVYNGATTTYSEIFKVTENTYLPDNIHPNVAGYELITPFISQWMKTLPIYTSDFTITNTPTEVTNPNHKINISDLVFVKDTIIGTYNVSGAGEWHSGRTGRSTHEENTYLVVNGNETIGLTESGKLANISYSVYEYNENKVHNDGGLGAERWLTADETLTLLGGTKYIAIMFKNGDGSASFTDEQLALLPTYIEIK